MDRIQTKAVDAFKAMGDVSHEERVSVRAHLLKCSVLLAIDRDSEEAQTDFN